jgi:DNA primase
MYREIVEACRFLLTSYPAAQETRDYLDSRLSQESQEHFGFGYFPDIKNIVALIDLVGEQALRDAGLFYTRDIEDSLFPRHIPCCHFEAYPMIMPFRNAYGKTVGIVGRTLLNDAGRKEKCVAKYKNTKETPEFKKGNLLFGLHENKAEILEKESVFVVEGQFDVIKANEAGLKNIVGLGTNSMSAYQYSVISRYTNNMFLLLDNDEAGEKGRARIMKKFGQFANIRNLYLPDAYKDIDEYISKTGITRYEDVLFVVKS